jgi:hypothetical protein
MRWVRVREGERGRVYTLACKSIGPWTRTFIIPVSQHPLTHLCRPHHARVCKTEGKSRPRSQLGQQVDGPVVAGRGALGDCDEAGGGQDGGGQQHRALCG